MKILNINFKKGWRTLFKVRKNIPVKCVVHFFNSFKCGVLSLSTYYYQFSCNVQESRASGTTGYAARLMAALAHAIQVLRTVYARKSYQLDTYPTHVSHMNDTCLTHEPHMNDTTNCVKDGGEDERKRLRHDVRSDARKGNQQAGSKLSRSMVSVSSFNTLLIHCYYFTHTWGILRPYTKSASTRVTGWLGIASRLGRTLVHTCSTVVRVLFECCSSATRTTLEAHPKSTRSRVEEVSNTTRRAVEGQSKPTRRIVEQVPNNSRSRVEGLANRLPHFVCNDGKVLNDLHMNRLILRCFRSVWEEVRVKVVPVLVENKRSSQNGLNEINGFSIFGTSGDSDMGGALAIKERLRHDVRSDGSMGTDEVGIKRGYSRDIVLFVQQLRRMLDFLKEYFRGAMESLRYYVGNDGRISRLGLLTIFCVLFSSLAFTQAAAQTQAGIVLCGEVRSAADGQAIEGATISVDKKNAHTDKEGRFTISVAQPQGVVAIKHIGYQEQNVAYANTSTTLQVKLEPSDRQIEKVEVISTGYQQLPKERATGSFVQIDNKLFNRKVGSNVLDRLADVTPGLIFNNGKGAAAQMLIRGQTTLRSSTSVLIIVDNFPYEGDINNINPNDVENITVLKDAAASSIWGARAGNGVIVITTKRNTSANEPRIAFNANTTIGQKPDLFYKPQMSIPDFIDTEKMLFDRGFYTTYENSLNKVPLNPVVELLILKRDHPERAAELDREIEQMKNYDVRNDYEKYLYQAPVQQQYAFRVDGGSNSNRYYASFAYDKNRSEVVRNQGERFTATVGNTIALVKDKLELSGQAAFSLRKNENNGLSQVDYRSHRGISRTPIYPYARLADENGTPLKVVKDYSSRYLLLVAEDGLMDWTYKPLLDRELLDNTTKGNDLKLDAGLKYKLLKGFNVQALYQYWKADNIGVDLKNINSYYTRNEVNRMTQRSPTTGALSYPIPMGSIVDKNNGSSFAHNLRLQADLQLDIGTAHELNAILGYELRDQQMATFASRLYGYNEKVGVSQSVDFKNNYTAYFNPYSTSNRIPYMDKETGAVDRFRSVFSNASYSYDKRYTVSGSLRFDESNLFGVHANQKRVPLYSVGLAWHLANENFFQPVWVDKLSIRATYGKNGNVNRNLTAFTTASYSSADNLTRLPYASIRTPGDPNLRWEKIATYNLAVDFSVLKGRISGSAEYYNKDGKDIISPLSFPGTAGVKTVTGNFGRTNARGFELVLNTMPIDKTIRWTNQLLLNTVKDKVVEYYGTPHYPLDVMGSSDGITAFPIAGKPLWALYSLPWGGLDPENGDPIGYLDGEPSKDYAAIMGNVDMESLVYNGPVRPTRYGSFRNTFAWKELQLSFNISYRGGYYFKKETMDVSLPLNGMITHGDYDKAWKKPDDEKVTQVPSLKEPIDAGRERLYLYSSARIFKADQIRLQDIRLEYQLPLTKWGLSTLKAASIYAYANNLGLLWKKSDTEYDPDYANVDYLPVRTWSMGVNFTL